MAKIIAIVVQKRGRRYNNNPLSSIRRKMRQIACDKGIRTRRPGNFDKGLIVRVRQGVSQWRRGEKMAVTFDEIDEYIDIVAIKLKLRTMEDFLIFQQNTGIHTQRQFPGKDSPDNFTGWPIRR